MVKKEYYPFLDGLRAVAIAWVMFHHIFYKFSIYSVLNGDLGNFICRLGFVGFLGVDIFFVISGFLITGLLMEGLDDRMQIKRFYFRRFFKIFPHYLFMICIGLVVSLFLYPDTTYPPLSYVSYLLLFQNYVQPIDVLGHLWSIAIEEHFYFIYPLIMAVVCAILPKGSPRKKALGLIILGLILWGNLIRFWAFRPLHSIHDPMVWQVTHVRFDALLFGCLIRLLENRILSLPEKSKQILRTILFIAGIGLFFSFIFRFNKIGWAYYTLAYFASGAIIVSSLLGFIPLNKILGHPGMIWVGKRSYGIYLWHYTIILFFTKLVAPLGIVTAILFYITSTIALGALTTDTLERYFLNLRKKWFP